LQLLLIEYVKYIQLEYIVLVYIHSPYINFIKIKTMNLRGDK